MITQYYTEPARELPVIGEYDVVVCGGGPAGCSAAIAAARHGAKTLLLEKDGYLGGATVSQIVAVILSTNGVDFQGIWHEYLHGLQLRDAVRPFTFHPGHISSAVDTEQVKFVWDELLTAAGVDLLHHVYAATAIVEDGAATGLCIESKAGRQVIRALRVIDATGDGVVAAQSGVPWEQGDGTHLFAMACTKVFRLGGVADIQYPLSAETMQQLRATLQAAIARGEYTTPVVTTIDRLLGYIQSGAWQLPQRRHELLSVISRVLAVNPLDPWDLTYAEREGREQARQAADFYCRYVPGFEHAYLLDTSNHIGVRSSRRLHGLATVTTDDAQTFRKYDDSIARSSWEMDVWPADSYIAPAVDRESAAWRARRDRMVGGEYFDIRYGCIVAQGVDNLLMAGRCISAEHQAESSLRIQQTCMATGQAAGTTAAISLRADIPPRELDPMDVVRQLAIDRASVEPAIQI